MLKWVKDGKKDVEYHGSSGINVHTYKAHSLRGATATHLMPKGVERGLVQSRGQWTSSQTLDKYYNRLHQQTDWEAHLGENAAGRQASINLCCAWADAFPTENDKGS